MTSLDLGRPASRARGFGRVLRAEWTKVRTLRSTPWTLLTSAATTVGLGALFYTGHVNDYRQMSAAELKSADPVAEGLLMGLFIGLIGFAVVGLLVATGEYASGTIAATLIAVPRRLPALWAKALVVAAVVGAVATATEFAAFLVTQQMLAGVGVDAGLSTPGIPRAVLGAATYVTGTALLALGLGVAIRHTVGAVAATVVVFFVLPLVTLTQPESWDEATRFLPNAAGTAMLHTQADPALLSPGAGLAVFVTWIALALTAAAGLLRRRDW